MNKATAATLAATTLLLTACSHNSSTSSGDQAGRIAQASPSDQCAQHVDGFLQIALNSPSGQDVESRLLNSFGRQSPEYFAMKSVMLDAETTQARQGVQAALDQARPHLAPACQNAIDNGYTEATPSAPDESNDNDCTKTVMKALDAVWDDPTQSDQVLEALGRQYGTQSLVFQTYLAVGGNEQVTNAREARGVPQADITAHALTVQGCSGQTSTPTP